ncbi:MAG: ChbG/HpnK family deacetylase [Gammaproteobacteria bacterium]|nr:ChbG/HpnK family deacetylase [Gammaproteobacteria bacterium]
MNTPKKVILCADDFALNTGISAAIIELLNKQCISATSCMTTSLLWPEWGARLKPLASQADIGLHWDLTQFTPLSAAMDQGLKGPLSIGQTIIKAYSRQFSFSTLERECLLQLQSFSDVMGFAPHFIDGHQHIHQFPLLRDALLSACKTYFKKNMPPIRLVNGYPFLSPLRNSPLKLLIHALGRNAFKRQLDKAHWPYYEDFKGIYVFKGNPNVATLFKQFIQQVATHGIIMCHPGHLSDPATDPISQLREQEYTFLNSPQWQRLRQTESVQLCRYSEMTS